MIEESRRILSGLPTLTMVKPKKRMRRQRSQPNPVLSGQFTVITLVAPSPSLSASLIITTSSHSIPIIFFFKIKSKLQTLEPLIKLLLVFYSFGIFLVVYRLVKLGHIQETPESGSCVSVQGNARIGIRWILYEN